MTSELFRLDRLISPVFQTSDSISLWLINGITTLRHRHTLLEECFVIISLIELLCIRVLRHSQTRLETLLLACVGMGFDIRNGGLVALESGNGVAATTWDVLEVIGKVLIFIERSFASDLLSVIPIN